MGFILFLLVTATLLIRPSEHLPELASVPIYEALIVLCFVFSFGSVLEQFTLGSLETRPITVCVIGLLAAVVLSHLSQGNATAAGNSGLEFLKVIVYYVLLVGNVTTMLRLRILLVSMALCATVFVTLAVLHYHGVLTLPEPPPKVVAGKFHNEDRLKGAFITDIEYDAVSGQAVEFHRLRATGIYGDPNDLSLLIVTGLLIALWCLTDPKQGVCRVAWLGALILFVYALSLTQSRGGLLGLFAGIMALIYARYGWRSAIVMGVPAFILALAFLGGRMASISTSEGTGQQRIQLWSESIVALTSAPVFGIGMNELGALVGLVAHNSFVGAYAELGLFGGTLFFGTFLFATIGLFRLLKYPQWVVDRDLKRLLPFLAAVLVSYAVCIMSLSHTYLVPTYLILGMVAAAVNLAAGYVPALAQRLDGQLLQRLALGSVAFLAATYLFVRVLKV